MQIECKDISYQYPQTGTNVFDHLNCQITGAGFHALFGSSGLGKTTLARMIAREISGYAGQIRLDQFSEILYTHNLERFPGWASVVVPVDHLLANFAELRGFRVKSIFVTRMKGNSPQQMKQFGRIPVRESVVIFEKT